MTTGSATIVHWDLDGDGQFDDAMGDTAVTSFDTAGIHPVKAEVFDMFGIQSPAVDELDLPYVTPGDPPPIASPDAAAKSAGGASPSPCAAWEGPFVAVAVCDVEALSGALRDGKVRSHDNAGPLTSVPPGEDVASATGITQVVGAPLKPGRTVRIASSACNADVLTIGSRAAKGGSIATIRLRRGELAHGGRIEVLKAASGAGTETTPDAVTRTP